MHPKVIRHGDEDVHPRILDNGENEKLQATSNVPEIETKEIKKLHADTEGISSDLRSI